MVPLRHPPHRRPARFPNPQPHHHRRPLKTEVEAIDIWYNWLVIKQDVETILESVRSRGNRAVREALLKFDGVDLDPEQWLVPQSQARRALNSIPKENRRFLEASAERVLAFHRAEKRRAPRSWREQKSGVTWGQEIRPLESVGCYVPGGRFSYPSTVLMTALPARVAGVPRVVLCTPPKHLSPEVLAAAALAGVDEIYRIGGVVAIGVMAFGTKTVQPVDFIVGPGGAWVTEAKRQVFGTVGIDMLAGPSEIVIVADASATVQAVVSDLMAQAEHDPLARSTVVSTEENLLAKARQSVAPALRSQCRFERVSTLDDAFSLANRLAPEHLSLMVKNPQKYLKKVRGAGAVFLGSASPVAVGDYWVGPSHVLPTARTARFSSGLSVQTFLKRTSVMGLSPKALEGATPSVERFARAEGLERHAESVRKR